MTLDTSFVDGGRTKAGGHRVVAPSRMKPHGVAVASALQHDDAQPGQLLQCPLEEPERRLGSARHLVEGPPLDRFAGQEAQNPRLVLVAHESQKMQVGPWRARAGKMADLVAIAHL